MDCDVLVAASGALELLDAFAAEAELLAPLSPRWNGHRGWGVNRRQGDLRSSDRLSDGNGNCRKDIHTLAGEDRVGTDMRDDEEIARRPAVEARLALAPEANLASRVHSCGYLDIKALGLFRPPAAVTGSAESAAAPTAASARTTEALLLKVEEPSGAVGGR